MPHLAPPPPPPLPRYPLQHIIAQSIYQLGITFAILYASPSIKGYEFPTPTRTLPVKADYLIACVDTYCNTTPSLCNAKSQPLDASIDFVASCTKYTTDVSLHTIYADAFKVIDVRISSILFNAFIFLTLANEINCRKIDDEYNIFENIIASRMFIGVIVISAGFQVLWIEAASIVFNVVPLHWYEWLFCVGTGFGALAWSVIIKFVTKLVAPAGGKEPPRTFTLAPHGRIPVPGHHHA